MVTGFVLGGLVAGLTARIGRLSSKRLLLAVILGSICCGSMYQMEANWRWTPPSILKPEGWTWLFATMVDLQWVFWWILGGSILPLALTFILGLTRSMSPMVIGVCAGMGAGFLSLCWMDYRPAPYFTGALWRTGLGLQGLLCLACAMSTAGVQRLRMNRSPAT